MEHTPFEYGGLHIFRCVEHVRLYIPCKEHQERRREHGC